MVSSVSAQEVLGRIGAVRRQAIEAFRDRIRSHFGSRLRDLRLYGSAVRAEEHAESDIDLLILVEDATWNDRDAAWRIALDIDARLHPRLLDYEQYHQPRSRASGFYKELRKESVRL